MELIHFIQGNIRVRLIGNTPERFLNICNANEIHIRNVEYIDGSYYFWMSPGDFKKLLPVVRKTSMRPVIIEKKGLPFFIFRYRKHQCFLIGIMLSFFIIYLMSLYVWEINFEGNSVYSDEVMMNYLNQIDVIPGMRIKKIDCDDIEKQFRKNFKDITWISAEISGTRLQIYIKENDEDVLTMHSEEPCDLVATKDGTVESIITRCGTPMVKVGSEVKKGDILVSGEIISYDESGNFIRSKWAHADADICIRTIYEYESSIDKCYQYKIYTGKEKKQYYVDVYGKTLHLGLRPKYDSCEIFGNDYQVKLTKNFFLPVRYGSKEYVEYYIDTNFYTESEAERILESRFLTFLQNLEQKGVQILEKNVKIYENTASYSYAGQICVIEAAYSQAKPVDLMEGTGENEHR